MPAIADPEKSTPRQDPVKAARFNKNRDFPGGQ